MKVQTDFGMLTCTTGSEFKTGDRCLISVRPETAPSPLKKRRRRITINLPGPSTSASYIGNTIRYDVEIENGFIFKVDIQNPWFTSPFPWGESVGPFPMEITLGIPLAQERG